LVGTCQNQIKLLRIKMKTKNKEQEDFNKERIVDINLVLQYMQNFDITKEYFTEIGEGHLRGLASVKDELRFVSKEDYKKLKNKDKSLKVSVKELKSSILSLEEENKKLKEVIKKLKKRTWWKK